ncbi:MAG: hypothetical protein FWE23_04470 [Chitinivibrionia bacterium]|nr:hypothetical protein [Chitinivibrionia bacterium]
MKKIYTLIFIAISLVFAQDLNVNSIILSQNYEKIPVSQNRADSAFFATQIAFSRLVDYEAYETFLGREVLANIDAALRINRFDTNGTLQLYRRAILEGMAGSIHLKRNSFVRGISRTNESQRLWAQLLGSEFDNEANFALALDEYYRITLFSRSPRRDRLNAVLERMRTAILPDNKTSLYLSLSYIWVLQEQRLWDEAQKTYERFFAKFPNNTMMLRAAQTIAVDKENTAEIKRFATQLNEISIKRTPINYSDLLSARRALIFTSELPPQPHVGAGLKPALTRAEACELARETVVLSQNIDSETQRITWVRRHLDAIRRFAAGCR